MAKAYPKTSTIIICIVKASKLKKPDCQKLNEAETASIQSFSSKRFFLMTKKKVKNVKNMTKPKGEAKYP